MRASRRRGGLHGQAAQARARPAAGTAVVGAIKRAEQVALAMDCRAFRSSPQRTFMRRLTLARPDVAILIAAPALTVTSLIVSWGL